MEKRYFQQSCRLQPATLLKVTLLYGCFSCFLNCTNGAKSRKASHLQNRSYIVLIKSPSCNTIIRSKERRKSKQKNKKRDRFIFKQQHTSHALISFTLTHFKLPTFSGRYLRNTLLLGPLHLLLYFYQQLGKT